MINCAAYTDVDGAETHEPDALGGERHGCQLFAARSKASARCSCTTARTMCSTENATRPTAWTSRYEPQNAYGRTKARGEELLVARGCEHLILHELAVRAVGQEFRRHHGAFGPEQPSLRVVNDQRGRPTSARYLASAASRCWRNRRAGCFHVTDGGECTWYEFAQRDRRGDGRQGHGQSVHQRGVQARREAARLQRAGPVTDRCADRPVALMAGKSRRGPAGTHSQVTSRTRARARARTRSRLLLAARAACGETAYGHGHGHAYVERWFLGTDRGSR